MGHEGDIRGQPAACPCAPIRGLGAEPPRAWIHNSGDETQDLLPAFLATLPLLTPVSLLAINEWNFLGNRDLSLGTLGEIMKHLFFAAALSLLTVPAFAAAAPVQRLASDGAFTHAQFQVEVERDRDRDGWRRREGREDWRGRREWRERRGWREGREERCRVTIIRRWDGGVRRIRRCE